MRNFESHAFHVLTFAVLAQSYLHDPSILVGHLTYLT